MKYAIVALIALVLVFHQADAGRTSSSNPSYGACTYSFPCDTYRDVCEEKEPEPSMGLYCTRRAADGSLTSERIGDRYSVSYEDFGKKMTELGCVSFGTRRDN